MGLNCFTRSWSENNGRNRSILGIFRESKSSNQIVHDGTNAVTKIDKTAKFMALYSIPAYLRLRFLIRL